MPAVLAAQAPAAPATSATVIAAGHNVAVPSATAVRRTGAVVLDGRLDEAAWRAGAPITDFRQIDPGGRQAGVAADRGSLSISMTTRSTSARRCTTPQGAEGVATRLVRRDASFDSDYPRHRDRRVSRPSEPRVLRREPVGVEGRPNRRRHVVLRRVVGSGLGSGDAHRRGRVDRRAADSRTASSAFSRDSVQTWGLQVRRVSSSGATSRISGRSGGRREAGGPSRFGHLEGLRIRCVALAARAAAVRRDASRRRSRTPTGDPFNTHGRPTMRAGLDLKDRLTSNLTLDATINPDFGQVEVDPAVLNLSAFETFFPEKRPFFVEGAQVFDFGESFGCNFCSNVAGHERVLLAAHRPGADGRSTRATQNYRVRRRAGRDDDSRRGEDHRAHAAAATRSDC